MPRPFELFLSGLTLAFAGVTCSTDAQTPCEVLTERACGDSDKPGRQVCTADGRWSEECETVERECDTSECTSNGLCRTAELVSPARSASTWAVALGSKSVGLLTERVGGGPSSLSFEVLDGFGLANQPRVELKSTNESIAIAHLVASEGLFAANWETWAGRQRADVGVDVFSDSGQPQGRVRYANERRAGRLYPSSDGFTHVYFEGELQAQEISQQGEELGEPMVFQSPNFSVGNLALASNGQTQLLVASAHSTEPKLTAVLWDDSGRKIGDFTSLAQGYVEQLAADWNGSVFGVAWLLNDALWLAEIDHEPMSRTATQASTKPSSPLPRDTRDFELHHYRSDVLRYVSRLGVPQRVVEELTQDVFLIAYTRRESFRGEAALRNLALRHRVSPGAQLAPAPVQS